MAKVIELKSGADTVHENKRDSAQSKIEQAIQNTMQKVYMVGLSGGVRAMCVTILQTLNENKNMNPQKQLAALRKMCHENLAALNKDKQNQENPNVNDAENNTEKENKTAGT